VRPIQNQSVSPAKQLSLLLVFVILLKDVYGAVSPPAINDPYCIQKLRNPGTLQ
jgi:hypothetical protein